MGRDARVVERRGEGRDRGRGADRALTVSREGPLPAPLRTGPDRRRARRVDGAEVQRPDGARQKLWIDFLYWCRTFHADKLTWKEGRARSFWCPLIGHDFDRSRFAGHVQGVCKNCRVVIMADTEEALDEWSRRGRSPWGPSGRREREPLGRSPRDPSG